MSRLPTAFEVSAEDYIVSLLVTNIVNNRIVQMKTWDGSIDGLVALVIADNGYKVYNHPRGNAFKITSDRLLCNLNIPSPI